MWAIAKERQQSKLKPDKGLPVEELVESGSIVDSRSHIWEQRMKQHQWMSREEITIVCRASIVGLGK
jgi:hypothetical protein